MAMCQYASKQSVKTLTPTGRNADDRKWQHVAAMLYGRHTANHHLAVWYDCQYSRPAFRPFDIPTRSRYRYQLLCGKSCNLL